MHNWRDIVCKRLADAGLDPIADANLVEELAQHMEDRFVESRAAGATHDDAFAAALHELDHKERIVSALAKNRPAPLPPLHSRIAAIWQDVRYAARTLRRSPAFTFAAIATVALSTAPTIAALSVANWLFLRPVSGVSQPELLGTVMFGVPAEQGALTVVRPPSDFMANVKSSSASVDSMAGWQRTEVSIAAGRGEARMVQGEFVSGNYFDVLGVRMFGGRSFLPDEDLPPDGAPVAVLSHRLARTLFSDGSPIGGRITVNRHPLTVIGVAPREFAGGQVLERTDIWMTGEAMRQIQHLTPESRRPDRGPFYQYVIRRKPDAAFEQAVTELRSAIQSLSQNDPRMGTLQNVQPRLGRAFAAPPTSFGAVVAALAGVGALLITIAAANLANLFGFRCVRRVRETALRRALGASSIRLLQVNLAETVMVALVGSLAGLGLVFFAQNMIGGTIVTGTVEIPELPIDWHLLAMTVALAFGVSIVMGIAPARLSRRKDLALVIGNSGRTAGRTTTRLRTAFAVVQMALSLTLMVGALLFSATLQNLRRLDPGFEPKGLTAYDLEFRTQGYRPERISSFYRDLLTRVSGTPGVTAAAIAGGAPVLGGEIGMARNFRPEDAGSGQRYVFSHVSAGYFDALGIGLISGRGFTPEETMQPGLEAGVVISESLARRLYGKAAAVGQVLTIPAVFGEPQHDVRIIGVAEDVRWDALTDFPPLMLYRPLTRVTGDENLLVRSPDRTDLAIGMVRDAVKAIDPALPMRARVMEEMVSLKLTQQRTFAWALGGLATIGFLLAALGIHGLVSQSVIERTREFGIRLAVGARRGEIVRLVLRSMLVIVAAGAPLGSVLAAMMAFALRSRLFGVTPGDPGPYIVAVAALFVVVLSASLVPAWSASRANPTDVLRAE